MPVDFPSNPTPGTIVSFANGQSYRWNGGQWDVVYPTVPAYAWELVGDYTISAATELKILNLGVYHKLRYSGGFSNSVAGFLSFQFSTDNGTTYKAGATDYAYQRMIAGSTAVTAASGNATSWYLNSSNDAGVSFRTTVSGIVEDFNQALQAAGTVQSGLWASGQQQIITYYVRAAFSGPCNALRLFPSGGNFTGIFTLEGVRG